MRMVFFMFHNQCRFNVTRWNVILSFSIHILIKVSWWKVVVYERVTCIVQCHSGCCDIKGNKVEQLDITFVGRYTVCLSTCCYDNYLLKNVPDASFVPYCILRLQRTLLSDARPVINIKLYTLTIKNNSRSHVFSHKLTDIYHLCNCLSWIIFKIKFIWIILSIVYDEGDGEL